MQGMHRFFKLSLLKAVLELKIVLLTVCLSLLLLEGLMLANLLFLILLLEEINLRLPQKNLVS